MGDFCKKCGKVMKHKDLSHCSDECLFADIHSSESKKDDDTNAKSWDETSDPWI